MLTKHGPRQLGVSLGRFANIAQGLSFFGMEMAHEGDLSSRLLTFAP